MKYVAMLVALLMSGVVCAEQNPLQDIKQLVWKNRIILILSAEDDAGHEQLLEKYDDEIIDRDIVWFVLRDSEVVTNYAEKLSSEFVSRTKSSFPIGSGSVLLIGKDGGVKTRAKQLNLNAIFREIDSMPMRRQEMESSS